MKNKVTELKKTGNAATNKKNTAVLYDIPPHPQSVKQIGFCEEPNVRFRRTMEDAHCIFDNVTGDGTVGYYGIYDGHGGRDAVDFTAENFHLNLVELLKQQVPLPEILRKAHLITDQQLGERNILYNGTTTATLLVTSTKLYSANAGDARSVLFRGESAIRITRDHKASDKAEADRIREANGFVAMGRVNGVLSVARALGDHAMKEYVTGDPYMEVLDRVAEDKFVILACDGLWDVMSDEAACRLVAGESTASAMANKLVQQAVKLGSTDNISVMVLVF